MLLDKIFAILYVSLYRIKIKMQNSEDQEKNQRITSYNKSIILFLVVFVVVAVCAIVVLIKPTNAPDAASQEPSKNNIVVLNPKGPISLQERDLMVKVTGIMLIVVIPVFMAMFFIAWKYRAGKPESDYSPNMKSGIVGNFLLWIIPSVFIFIICIINWNSTHALDPSKPIASATKPLTIEVIALQWKWLFIYPEQNIATVNYIQFPANTPINFKLTADAPMNSFWIPQLGGQMYAMSGMQTQLHLMANQVGEFQGSDAEISGKGFAGMRFIAKATSQNDFDNWVKSVKLSSTLLSKNVYDKLAEPSENNTSAVYSSVKNNLYNSVLMKFMSPHETTTKNNYPMEMEKMQ